MLSGSWVLRRPVHVGEHLVPATEVAHTQRCPVPDSWISLPHSARLWRAALAPFAEDAATVVSLSRWESDRLHLLGVVPDAIERLFPSPLAFCILLHTRYRQTRRNAPALSFRA